MIIKERGLIKRFLKWAVGKRGLIRRFLKLAVWKKDLIKRLLKMAVGERGLIRRFLKRVIGKKGLILGLSLSVIAGYSLITYCYYRMTRATIEFEVHLNSELIYFSDYSEPPQFAVWLMDNKSGALKNIFVTSRAATGDWEGKADVPSAIPYWTKIFKQNKQLDRTDDITVSGATPKEEFFRLDVETDANKKYTLFIEVNLAGDYNDFYPQIDPETYYEDEFACGQPALLYISNVVSTPGNEYSPSLHAMSFWKNGESFIAKPDSTITSADKIFDQINIKITKPKFRFINLNKQKL
jgi:hypothetical protein